MTPDVNVVFIDFPAKGKEMVMENEDGSFTIMINSKLTYNGQVAAYNHAMKHIKNSDFQKHQIQAIEAAAHGPVLPYDTQLEVLDTSSSIVINMKPKRFLRS